MKRIVLFNVIIGFIVLALFVVVGFTMSGCSKSAPHTNESVTENYNSSEELGIIYMSSSPKRSQLRSDKYVTQYLGPINAVKLADDFYYSKHINSETLDIMYIIYDGTIVDSCWYTSKWFTFSEFEKISNGSSFEDVLGIDNSTDFKMMYALYQETYHLCNTGYMIIYWVLDGDVLRVKNIEYVEDELISMLYSCENNTADGSLPSDEP